MDLIRNLNEEQTWRAVFGKPSQRLKDRELILRFFAFFESAGSYSRPMGEFLNTFASSNQQSPPAKIGMMKETFLKVVSVIGKSLGASAFRPEGSLNAAVFDSVMVGLV